MTPAAQNLAHEIACTLPREPLAAPLHLLVREFGLTNHGQLIDLLNQAKIDFATRRGDEGGRAIFVPRRWWKVVTKRCEAYWRETYGE